MHSPVELQPIFLICTFGLLPYFRLASMEGSGETTRMHGRFGSPMHPEVIQLFYA